MKTKERIEEQLIEFETGKMAKSKGYPIILGDQGYYFIPGKRKDDDEFSTDSETIIDIKHYLPAPTQSILQKWLRDAHKIHVQVFNVNKPVEGKWSYEINQLPIGVILLWSIDSPYFNSYEDALEDALQKSLKIIKK